MAVIIEDFADCFEPNPMRAVICLFGAVQGGVIGIVELWGISPRNILPAWSASRRYQSLPRL
jgi:hypothetical protein